MIYGLPGEAGVSAETIATPWLFFFLTVGVLVSLVGVAAFFLLPNDAILPNRAPYFKNLIYGFRPSTVKKHPLFYITLLSFLFFNIAIDAFMPYYLVYFQNSLNYSGLTFYLGMGIIILLSSALTILVGVFMEKIGKLKVAFGAIFFLALGSLVLYFTTTYALVITFATTMMFGYLIGTAVLGAELRDRTPENEVGLFQGVRMVFSVMLPMVIGSSLSEAVFTATALNEYGEPAKVPDHNMFLVVLFAAIAAILPLLLLTFARKKEKKEEE
jgi:MFS family permease